MNRKLVYLVFSVIVFLAGLYFYLTYSKKEFMTNQSEDRTDCPDLLVRKGTALLLYNTKNPTKDGENPLPFFNLDEYINYLEIQRRKGNHCPVLFLQAEITTQGEEVYRMRPSPFDLQGGAFDPTLFKTQYDGNISIDGKPIKVLDASREGGFNQNMYAGFDPYGLHIGEYTNLDAIHDQTSNQGPLSENPMDPNWGGVQITENAIRQGNYVDNYVSKPIFFTPKTTYLPDIYGAGPLPPNEMPDALKPQYE